MIKVEAKSSNQKLILKKNKSITVKFPKISNQNYDLFYGRFDKDYSINWKYAKSLFEEMQDDTYEKKFYLTIEGSSKSNGGNGKSNSRKKKREKQKIEDKYTNNDNLDEISLLELNYYVFSLTELGWINCDKFYENKNPKFNLLVKTSKNATVKVIFKKINSIMSAYYTDDGYVFANIPKGEDIVIIATKEENEKLVYSFTETITNEKVINNLVFEPVTFNELKNKIDSL